MALDAAKVRLLIADDHPIFRDGLRRVLDDEPDFRVVGEAADGLQAAKLASELKPDVLLLDLAMPVAPGMETLRMLAASAPELRTIVLTASIDTGEMIEAIQLGARGVMLKGSTSAMLCEGIRNVVQGRFWVGHEMVSDLVEALRRLIPPPADSPPPQKDFGLSAREMQMLTAIVGGYANKEIALKFSLSEHTVKHHITSLFDKLGVSNRVELALFAISHRLVKDE